MQTEQMPNLNAGFWIILPSDTNVSDIKQHLPIDTIFDYYPDSVNATVAEVENYYALDIDAVLTKLFSLCDLEILSKVAKDFNGKIHIGLWYYCYGIKPSVIFEGENMSIIHKLEADLSIDAY